jgi:hypothetical protein
MRRLNIVLLFFISVAVWTQDKVNPSPYGNFLITSVGRIERSGRMRIIVAKGQKIANMGSVGADSVHLHFEIRLLGSTVQAQAIDPVPFLPDRPNSITLGTGVKEQNGTLANDCSD